MAKVLITGGVGFIGSHTCLSLLEAGHELVVLDSFTNSDPEALKQVVHLAGLSGWHQPEPGSWATAGQPARVRLVQGDVRQASDLKRAMESPRDAQSGPIEAVLHFAGLKDVGESVSAPLRYWDVNLAGSRTLLEVMQAHGCRTLVFSSSATVYGYPDQVPIPESAVVRPINPYGHSKAAVEQLLGDVEASEPGWRIARLRYFNPVGAHPSGRIGEAPCGVATNLFPVMAQVALGRRSHLEVYGADWPTPDGTGIRDYIHVMDLAEGHARALEMLLAEPPQLLTLNLGTGKGCSVLELTRAFEAACGRTIPLRMAGRRPGDMALSVADPSEASRRLGWQARRSLQEMCRDGWCWQRTHPWGYVPH